MGSQVENSYERADSFALGALSFPDMELYCEGMEILDTVMEQTGRQYPNGEIPHKKIRELFQAVGHQLPGFSEAVQQYDRDFLSAFYARNGGDMIAENPKTGLDYEELYFEIVALF